MKRSMAIFLAEKGEDLRACLLLRRHIFVKELKMFSRTDKDEYDREAIHIGLKKDGVVIGTVRVYEKERGLWFGGRLAVMRNEREGRAGRLLVRAAESLVREKEAEKFFAMIYEKNVNFFKKLGWKVIEGPTLHYGIKHYLMKSNLYKI